LVLRLRKDPDDETLTRFQDTQSISHDVAELTPNPVADDSVANGFWYDEADQGRSPVGCLS